MSNDNLPPDRDQAAPEFSALDMDALFNLRAWVEQAVLAKGGKIVGAGIGCGGSMGIADLEVELEGYAFNLEIRPLPAKGSQP